MQRAYTKFEGEDNINCLVIQHDLPRDQSAFVNLYMRQILYKDDYSILPQNLRDCMKQIQPEMRKFVDLIQACDPLFNIRDPNQSQECE